MKASDIILQASQIRVQVGTRQLLQLEDYQLAAGQLQMLLGPNGAGKSTLLKVLSGQLSPSQGQVYLQQRPLADWSLAALARQRAVLSQQPLLAFPLRVWQVVQLGFSPWPEIKVDEVLLRHYLALVDGENWFQQSYPSLSGGEQQRVQLARVLAQLLHRFPQGTEDLTGKVLLLDEPLAALDLRYQHQVLQLLRRLCQRGLAVVCIIHDINLAALYADQLLLLQQGIPVFTGQAAQLAEADWLGQVYGVAAQAVPHVQQAKPQWQWLLPDP